MANESSDSLAMELFKQEIMPNAVFNSNIRYFNESEDIENVLADNNSMIALLPTITSNRALRPLGIEKEQGEAAYSPTAENVYFGDYPLSLPFVLAVS